ncbi:MAG: hypothetical protein MHPSP_001664 [Paramarteilia canceri]
MPEQNKPNHVSVAIPCSVLRHKRSLAQKTVLVSQIARFCAIFKVKRILVYDDIFSTNLKADDENFRILVKILKYMECPQYLRKILFKEDPDLKLSGIMEPLGIASHPLISTLCLYRIGCIDSIDSDSCLAKVNVGLNSLCTVELRKNSNFDVNQRIIVKLKMKNNIYNKVREGGKLFHEGVQVLSEEVDEYLGYKVIARKNFLDLFKLKEKPFSTIIGTSENGMIKSNQELALNFDLSNTLIVFGGIEGLEHLFLKNSTLKGIKASQFFDSYLNTCPNQGTRTIRTEEAMCITLSSLQDIFQ